MLRSGLKNYIKINKMVALAKKKLINYRVLHKYIHKFHNVTHNFGMDTGNYVFYTKLSK